MITRNICMPAIICISISIHAQIPIGKLCSHQIPKQVYDIARNESESDCGNSDSLSLGDAFRYIPFISGKDILDANKKIQNIIAANKRNAQYWIVPVYSGAKICQIFIVGKLDGESGYRPAEISSSEMLGYALWELGQNLDSFKDCRPVIVHVDYKHYFVYVHDKNTPKFAYILKDDYRIAEIVNTHSSILRPNAVKFIIKERTNSNLSGFNGIDSLFKTWTDDFAQKKKNNTAKKLAENSDFLSIPDYKQTIQWMKTSKMFDYSKM